MKESTMSRQLMFVGGVFAVVAIVVSLFVHFHH